MANAGTAPIATTNDISNQPMTSLPKPPPLGPRVVAVPWGGAKEIQANRPDSENIRQQGNDWRAYIAAVERYKHGQECAAKDTKRPKT
jgi:hypothetical protein